MNQPISHRTEPTNNPEQGVRPFGSHESGFDTDPAHVLARSVLKTMQVVKDELSRQSELKQRVVSAHNDDGSHAAYLSSHLEGAGTIAGWSVTYKEIVTSIANAVGTNVFLEKGKEKLVLSTSEDMLYAQSYVDAEIYMTSDDSAKPDILCQTVSVNSLSPMENNPCHVVAEYPKVPVLTPGEILASVTARVEEIRQELEA
ncbi:MAG: hypothetical protein WBO35_05830 [Candidatus Saccharimonadales bacterium]